MLLTIKSNTMKFDWKGYFQPTPKLVRQLGDALLASTTAVAGYAIFADSKVIAGVAMGAGVLGKFLSNFFKDDNATS